MAPRNRHTSPSASPSSTPPSGGLTKRQRQALRIHRPPIPSSTPDSASSPVAASPPDIPSSPPEPDLLPSLGTSPASLPTEGIRIRHVSLEEDERERASPSKYPTPLPDEEDDELPVPAPVSVMEEEAPIFEVADMEENEKEVPVGTLIDVQEEEEEPLVPHEIPRAAEPREPARDVEVLRRPKEMTPEPRTASRPPDVEVDTVRKARRRRSPPSPPFQPQGVGGVQGQVPGHGQQAHLRAPEAPRHPPPRALSALSHTLRALAASTQAVTSTATAYAHAYAHANSSAYSHSQLNATIPSEAVVRRDANARGKEDEEEEVILGARWDEVVDV